MFVRAGGVTCLLGDTARASPTLIKVLSGSTSPPTGVPVRRSTDRAQLTARRADRGIATVYQDLAMIPLLSVWRNFFLARSLRRAGSAATVRCQGAKEHA